MLCNICTVDIKVCFYDLYIKVLLCIGPLGGLTLPPVQVALYLCIFLKKAVQSCSGGAMTKQWQLSRNIESSPAGFLLKVAPRQRYQKSKSWSAFFTAVLMPSANIRDSVFQNSESPKAWCDVSCCAFFDKSGYFLFFDCPECSITSAGHRAVYYILGGFQHQ